MKGRLRYIIAALLALALVITYIAVASDASPEKTGLLFIPRSDETIEKIEVKNAFGAFDFRREAGEWLVSDGSGEYHTNSDKMSLLTSSLLKFSVLRVLDTEQAEYGLATPQAAVSFQTSRGRSGVLLVGNSCVNASESYARADSVDGVIITDAASVAQLTGSLAAYRTKEVFAVDLAAISSLTYTKAGQEPLTLVREDTDNWRISSPFASGARRLEIGEFLAGLTSWSIADYPAEDKVGAGEETLTLTDAQGQTQTIVFGGTEGTLRYARIGGKEDIVALYAADVDLSVLTAEALLYEAPLYTALDNTQGFSIVLPGREYSFSYDAAAQVAQCNGSYIDYNALIGVYYRYVLLLADGWDTRTAPGEAVAAMQTYLADGSVVEMTLYERDAQTLFMDYGGAGGFYLESSRLDLLRERLAAFD